MSKTKTAEVFVLVTELLSLAAALVWLNRILDRRPSQTAKATWEKTMGAARQEQRIQAWAQWVVHQAEKVLAEADEGKGKERG